MPWQQRRARRGEDPAERSADPAGARARALALLTGRDYASAELYEKLCARFTPEAAAGTVAALVEAGLVDDQRYAEAKARSLRRARKSRLAAALALRGKGLTDGQIDAALEAAYAPARQGRTPSWKPPAPWWPGRTGPNWPPAGGIWWPRRWPGGGSLIG